jgi:hypothetical protein
VEEEKFREVPCTVTRIAFATATGKCLQGYRMTPGATDEITDPKGGSNCDLALDVVVYRSGSLSIEADTLIFDPYKITAIGHQTSQFCYVNGNPGYGLEDFQDMNQMTRQGANWRNPVNNGEDKSIEFSYGAHNCIAAKKNGPLWGGGYVYVLHASICRTDAAAMRAEDVAYVLGSLQIRQYDPAGNLR